MLFSVIIPTYNKGPFLKRAVDSVLSQSFKDFELVVVDNNSSDNTLAILTAIQADQLVVLHEKNQGVSYARNKGIAHAKGTYICFLDADDSYETEHLHYLAELIDKNPDVGVVSNRYQIVSIHGHKIKNTYHSNWLDTKSQTLNQLFHSYSVGTPMINTNSVAVSKKTLIEVGLFDVQLKVAEDIDLWIRLALKTNFVFGEYISTTYFHNVSNKSSDHLHIRSYEYFFDKINALYHSNSIAFSGLNWFDIFKSRMVFGIAFSCIKLGNQKEAKKWLSIDLLKHQNKVKIQLLKIMCFLPNFINQAILLFLRKLGLLNI